MKSEAKNFICSNRYAVLSTIDNSGTPFGSLVPYVYDQQIGLIIQVAQIAEHYKNLKTNPSSSLLVVDRVNSENPAQDPRATIITNFIGSLDDKRKICSEKFKSVFKNHIPDEIENSFSYFTSEVLKVRWIGGFAKVGWISAEEWKE